MDGIPHIRIWYEENIRKTTDNFFFNCDAKFCAQIVEENLSLVKNETVEMKNQIYKYE
jgi:UDP-N-acetylglucosamine pyrophosphorylase